MRITKVEYVSGYKIKLTFGNKEIRIVDLSEKIKNASGIFLPLKNLEYFKKVAVDDCQLSICWPNGADICPDVLFEMGLPVHKKKRKPSNPKSVNRNSKRSSRRSKVKTRSKTDS